MTSPCLFVEVSLSLPASVPKLICSHLVMTQKGQFTVEARSIFWIRREGGGSDLMEVLIEKRAIYIQSQIPFMLGKNRRRLICVTLERAKKSVKN